MSFIGRISEIELIQKKIDSNKPELGIVYGRRRIGKSTLLKQCLKSKGDLYFEGLQKTSGKKQIAHFMDQLAQQTGAMRIVANNWKEAFQALSSTITKGKHTVVFDEFPWMASGRTELVSLLKYYWDNDWKNNPHLTLVICGSVASFMLKHIVHSQALHNRKTFEIKLGPLPLNEIAHLFIPYRSGFEILQFAMVFGGVPKYLEQIDPKKSLLTTVDELCFQKNSFFLNEFETLFKEQFNVIRTYEEIVSCLAKGTKTKEALAKALHKKGGGGLSMYIRNLEQADFVKTFAPYSLKGLGLRTKRIHLWDEWLRFYFTYMEPYRSVIANTSEKGLFASLAEKSFSTYCGLAFEQLCLKNLPQIMNHLEIPWNHVRGYGPFFRQSPRKGKMKGERGLQIDILVERKGHVLMLMECKYSTHPVGTSVIHEVEAKRKLLHIPKTYSLEKILIAPGGVASGVEQEGYFHHILGLSSLIPEKIPSEL